MPAGASLFNKKTVKIIKHRNQNKQMSQDYKIAPRGTVISRNALIVFSARCTPLHCIYKGGAISPPSSSPSRRICSPSSINDLSSSTSWPTPQICKRPVNDTASGPFELELFSFFDFAFDFAAGVGFCGASIKDRKSPSCTPDMCLEGPGD